MELNYNIKAELDTSNNAEEPVWSDLGKTMTNLTMSLNEVMTRRRRAAAQRHYPDGSRQRRTHL